MRLRGYKSGILGGAKDRAVGCDRSQRLVADRTAMMVSRGERGEG